MYKTNQQCWNEVSNSFKESLTNNSFCIEMFGQENLISLSDDQRDLFWESV